MKCKQELLLKIEEMKLDYVIALEYLRVDLSGLLNDFQLQEIENMIKWLNKEGSEYYKRIQDNIQTQFDANTIQSIYAILASYDKVLNRLLIKAKHLQGQEKVDEGMHVANWICSTPYRFALRLLQFDIDVL